MTNLAMSKEEAKAEYGEISTGSSDENLPRYPYGLSLHLDDEVLAKLGIKDLPKVGSTMQAQITITITGTSQRATQSSKKGEEMRTCVDMQITDMDIADTGKKPADVLYPSK